MPHAHVGAALRRRPQWELAAGRGDSAGRENHSAVVQRAAFAENRAEQGGRHFGIDRLAGLDKRVQRHLPLDGDQSAHAVARKSFRRVGELVRHGVALVDDEKAEDAVATNDHEAATELGLEDHDQAKHHGGDQVIEDSGQHGQVEAGDHDLGDQEKPDHY